MIIQISYGGDNLKFKYFNKIEDMKDFIEKFLEVNSDDFESIQLLFYRGEDEIRVRKTIKEEDLKDE